MYENKDLIIPFSFEDRRPIHLDDQFFYLPPNLILDEKQKFPFFDKKSDLVIEYCSGNGHWILDKAEKNPHKKFLAVEMRFERVRRIWVKAKNQGIKNLLVVWAEANLFTEYFIPDQILNEIYINFPDPWPKTRHAKNRLIGPAFIENFSRACNPDALWTVATDDFMTCSRTIGFAEKSRFWQSIHPDPFFIKDYPNYGISYFESLWRKKGRDIYYLQFKKKNRGRGI